MLGYKPFYELQHIFFLMPALSRHQDEAYCQVDAVKYEITEVKSSMSVA